MKSNLIINFINITQTRQGWKQLMTSPVSPLISHSYSVHFSFKLFLVREFSEHKCINRHDSSFSWLHSWYCINTATDTLPNLFLPPLEYVSKERSIDREIVIYIYTYIIGHYNPLVRITAKLPTPLMLCALISYVSSGINCLTSTPNERFLRNFFMAGLFTLRVFAGNLQWGNRRGNFFFFFFIFRFDAWPGIRTRTLHLISQHTAYYITATSVCSQ